MITVGSAEAGCAANAYSDEGGRPSETFSAPAGSFSNTVTIRNSSGTAMTPKHVVCGYLEYTDRYVAPDAPSAATASTYTGSEPKFTYYANGGNTLDPARADINKVGMGCGDTYYGNSASHPCLLEGAGTITVGAATRKRLKLPSALLARGTIEENGEGTYKLEFAVSKAIRKRLARLSSIAATLRIKIVGPFTKTFTLKMTMPVHQAGKAIHGAKPLRIRWTEGETGDGDEARGPTRG
jgi:hypothetical protein